MNNGKSAEKSDLVLPVVCHQDCSCLFSWFTLFQQPCDLRDFLSLLFFDGDFVMVLKDRANEIYKRVEDQKSSRGRNQDALLAACLYIACRQEDKPRTVKGTAYEFFNIWMLPDFSFPK